MSAQQVVILEYQDLVDGKDLTAEIERAYGFDGLGILGVRGVPGFPEKRKALLPMAHRFAHLPDDKKAKYEHPESFFSFGWSHGKEVFGGVPDYSKGSYYANPQYDRPVDDEELIKKHIAFIHPNIWPDEDVSGFSDAFKDCGRLMVQVGELLAAQCDRYVRSKCPTYPENRLANVIAKSHSCKGRLLHYFDKAVGPDGKDGGGQQKADEKEDSWCGWHNDHGSLTSLCIGMFLDSEGNEVPAPNDTAGLYIRTRNGETVKGVIPTDCIGFQIGETSQVHSGGVLQATPHCVMAGKSTGVSRQSFAVFMEPDWDEAMSTPEGTDPNNAKAGSRKELLPPGVPPLEERWEPSISFGEFTSRTLKGYY